MAHELDMSNNRANMAYVGEEPWHGLGQKLTRGAALDVWTREAGLDFTVRMGQLSYETEAEEGLGVAYEEWLGKNVLYRTDTRRPLGFCSPKYQIVQPAEVLGFFKKLLSANKCTIETAGSLMGGRKIWALAKMSEGDVVLKGDVVRPYLLLATSFDGTLATVAKFTAVRAVCNNTVTLALNEKTKTAVRTTHNFKFNPEATRQELGIELGLSAFESWLQSAKALAAKPLNGEAADATLQRIFRVEDEDAPDWREGYGYKRIMRLFEGEAIGAQLTGGQTGWALFNAVTQWVDHERGHGADTRLNAAWFGIGERIKMRAMDEILAV